MRSDFIIKFYSDHYQKSHLTGIHLSTRHFSLESWLIDKPSGASGLFSVILSSLPLVEPRPSTSSIDLVAGVVINGSSMTVSAEQLYSVDPSLLVRLLGDSMLPIVSLPPSSRQEQCVRVWKPSSEWALLCCVEIEWASGRVSKKL